jgi:hypothetical protein
LPVSTGAPEIKKNALLGNLTNKKPEMALTEAMARHWLEHGQHLPSRRIAARRAQTAG